MFWLFNPISMFSGNLHFPYFPLCFGKGLYSLNIQNKNLLTFILGNKLVSKVYTMRVGQIYLLVRNANWNNFDLLGPPA